jgi:CPA1 family monovalent cation:H+ antiporter
LLALLRFFDRPLPLKWQHVLFLGNVKGSLSMALVLSLPLGLPGREQLITLVFGTVLLSLVVQGLSLPWFVRRLNISPISALSREIESLQLSLITSKAAQEELNSLHQTGVLPKAVYEELRASYQARIANSERNLRDLYNQRSDSEDNHEDQKFVKVRRQLLLAEKGAINEALRRGILSEDLARDYLQRLNRKLLQLEDD